MSEQDVDIARAGFEAWNRGDYEAWIGALDEEAEFFPRFIAEMFAEWERVRFEVDEILDAGEHLARFYGDRGDALAAVRQVN